MLIDCDMLTRNPVFTQGGDGFSKEVIAADDIEEGVSINSQSVHFLILSRTVSDVLSCQRRI